MNLKNQMIMEEYREEKGNFLELGDVVINMLHNAIKQAGIMVSSIEHRVKTEKSLAGKLELKDGKYRSLSDITDILGSRIICFFSDDVDRVTVLVENLFAIDWENSVDKRAKLNPNAFGYLSVHYICYLPSGQGYPEEICNKKFEIQIRSTLQHTWAEIEHDLGYKSDFGIPKQIRREFSRVAGLLEIADSEFINIRDNIHAYGDDIREKITSGAADSIPIDMVSLNEYMKRNIDIRAFLKEVATICGAEINEISPENYLPQLIFLGKETLGDLNQMLHQNHELALKLAEHSLADTDLDILSSNVVLRYLCHAELLNNSYTLEQITEFMTRSTTNLERAKKQAARLLRTYEEIRQL